MKAMILAAGRGERMRPLTDTTPKPLLEVGGRALIEYHLAALAAAGVSDVVINLAWLGEQIRERIGDGSDFGVAVHYSDEGATALETGGGIAKALPLLGSEPFWLVNGDVWCDYAFTSAELADTDLGRLLLVSNPEHNSAGDFGLAGDRVINAASDKYTFSGISLLRPELITAEVDEIFPLAPLLRVAADAGRLAGELHTGDWSDIGTPARLTELDSRLATG